MRAPYRRLRSAATGAIGTMLFGTDERSPPRSWSQSNRRISSPAGKDMEKAPPTLGRRVPFPFLARSGRTAGCVVEVAGGVEVRGPISMSPAVGRRPVRHPRRPHVNRRAAPPGVPPVPGKRLPPARTPRSGCQNKLSCTPAPDGGRNRSVRRRVRRLLRPSRRVASSNRRPIVQA